MSEFLTADDWPIAAALLVARQKADPAAQYIPYQITRGEKAGFWIATIPEFGEEFFIPCAERELCEWACLQRAEARAEAAADPYPERIWPEAEFN